MCWDTITAKGVSPSNAVAWRVQYCFYNKRQAITLPITQKLKLTGNKIGSGGVCRVYGVYGRGGTLH